MKRTGAWAVICLLALAGGCGRQSGPAGAGEGRFYRVRARALWGEYGEVLINGLVRHQADSANLVVERTGPFIPPMTVPDGHHVVVTDDFRKKLEASGLGTFEFLPVVRARVVEYHWNRWDLSADEPRELPSGGEPENYVLSRRHAPAMADAIGPLWQMMLKPGAQVDVADDEPDAIDLRMRRATWNGTHFFYGAYARPMYGRCILVSETAKRWLEPRVGDWLRFEEIESGPHAWHARGEVWLVAAGAIGLTVLLVWGLWRASRPRWTVEIIVDHGQVRSCRGLPPELEETILGCLRDAMQSDRRIGLWAMRDRNGRLRVAFSGRVDPAAQQRVHDLLLNAF